MYSFFKRKYPLLRSLSPMKGVDIVDIEIDICIKNIDNVKESNREGREADAHANAWCIPNVSRPRLFMRSDGRSSPGGLASGLFDLARSYSKRQAQQRKIVCWCHRIDSDIISTQEKRMGERRR
jgi:hypothetical protein